MENNINLQRMWPDYNGNPADYKSIFYVGEQIKEGSAPTKKDQAKLDWSLLPMEALEPVVEVLEFGKTKYSAWNWAQGNGFEWTRVISACLRHIFAWIRGEDLDPETNKSHLAHATCNLIFLLYYIQHKDRYVNDNRNKR